MTEIKLGMVEARFAEIVWQNAPLSTKELVARCEEELNWKRTTTYTVLKKLCERGIFEHVAMLLASGCYLYFLSCRGLESLAWQQPVRPNEFYDIVHCSLSVVQRVC